MTAIIAAITCALFALLTGYFALSMRGWTAAYEVFACITSVIGCGLNVAIITRRIRAKQGANHGRPGSPAGSAGSPTGANARALSASGAASFAVTLALPGIPPSGANPDPGLIWLYGKVLDQAKEQGGDYSGVPRWHLIGNIWNTSAPTLPQSKSTEAVIGYRAWRVVREEGAARLKAMHMDADWLPGEPMRGTIETPATPPGVHAYSAYVGLSDEVAHAVNPFNALRYDIVVGTVSLWGKVVICERGYRAEYGYPRQLCWTNAGEGVLQELARVYGCEVYQP